MNEQDIQQIISEYRDRYPALLSVSQAAEIADVEKSTLYEWSSVGDLDGIKAKRGGRIRLHRDRFVRWLMSDQTAAAA